ncbi:MAG: metal-dependent transcriptional regulator [Saprospiraceae bacterium]
MLTVSEENYLKAIYKILERSGETNASTKAIASELGTSPASVTDMLRKLSEKELLNYEKYYGVSLSREGQRLALELIRKHRLWEVFLCTQLRFAWDEVHEIAEQLEHVQSDELIHRLDEFLGYPKFDPHGDPIPNKNGSFTFRQQSVLSQIRNKDSEVLILGVRTHQKPFLQYLDTMSIHPGRKLKIRQYNSFEKIHTLETEQHEIIYLGHEISSEIWVRLA